MDSHFVATDKVLFIDFDHTCYDTDAFLLEEIRRPMLESFNIPTHAWEESYEKAVKLGYTLENHVLELQKIMDQAPALEEIQKFGEAIVFHKYLYADVEPFLVDARKNDYKIMLLSFGATNWQDKKVLGVGLDKLVDVIKYTKQEGSKMEVIKSLASACYKVVFIDNNAVDLDAAKKELPKIETYLINRPHAKSLDGEDAEYIRIRYMESRKMAERQPLLTHNICKNLEEIVLK